jgi:hypothetical protein
MDADRRTGLGRSCRRCGRLVVGLGLALALWAPGCSADRFGTRGHGKAEAAKDETELEPSSPTLGVDKSKATPGQTMPATGLGVDLI